MKVRFIPLGARGSIVVRNTAIYQRRSAAMVIFIVCLLAAGFVVAVAVWWVVEPSVCRPVAHLLCISRDFPPSNPAKAGATYILAARVGGGGRHQAPHHHDHERRRRHPTKILPYTSKHATPPLEIASPASTSHHDEVKHLQKEAEEISFRLHSRCTLHLQRSWIRMFSRRIER